MDRVEHDLTDDQWRAIQSAWGGCAYCSATDEPLQRDCVLALSRGGRYTLDNIVPAFLLRSAEIRAMLAAEFPPLSTD
jgi:hypothetical protein